MPIAVSNSISASSLSAIEVDAPCSVEDPSPQPGISNVIPSWFKEVPMKKLMPWMIALGALPCGALFAQTMTGT